MAKLKFTEEEKIAYKKRAKAVTVFRLIERYFKLDLDENCSKIAIDFIEDVLVPSIEKN